MKHKTLVKGLVITAIALILGFAGPVFSATPPKVGDPISSVVPSGLTYDSSQDQPFTCNTGTLDMTEFDRPDGSPAVDLYKLGNRLVIVATLDTEGGLSALYGDSIGKGKITDIGQPGDSAFGEGPCDYLDGKVKK